MGNGQSCFGQPSCPERLQASDYDVEEKGGGLATSVITLMKNKCLLSRKRSGRYFHPLKKQNEQEKEIITDDHNANEQYPTLEQWFLSSPVSGKRSANSETHLYKHFSNRVHPALLDHIVSSPNQRSSLSKDKLLEEVNGQLVDALGDVIPRSSLSRSQSERTKKRVSFRLPEKDEIIIYASPEVEGHDARA